MFIIPPPPTALPVGGSSLPNVGDVLLGWFMPMTFRVVKKAVTGYQAAETAVSTMFQGVIQPMSGKQLMLLPEGQRAWKWYTVHSDTSLALDVDDIVVYKDASYRVMGQADFREYGYLRYDLVQDWVGADPLEASP